MTVAAKRRIAFRDEDGVTLNFPVPFRYMSSNELEVARIEDGGITILTEETEWTASDGDSDAGGTVTLVTTKAGAQLRIRGKTSRAQTADYTDTDAFPAEAHERALDREAMAGQDRDVDIEAALKVPAGQQGYSVEDVGEGQVIGLVGGKLTGVDNDPASAANSAAEAAASATLAGNASSAANSSAVATENLRDEAQEIADQMAESSLGNAYVPGARLYVPQQIGSFEITAAGADGTDGIYERLALSGDNLSAPAYADITVSGGVITQVTVNSPGLYIGNAITVGTVDLSSIVGLTGATVTPVSEYRFKSGEYYYTDHVSDAELVALFQVQGVAPVEIDDDVDWMSVGRARAWAEGDDPAGDGSARSAKGWAESIASGADARAQQQSTIIYQRSLLEQLSVRGRLDGHGDYTMPSLRIPEPLHGDGGRLPAFSWIPGDNLFWTGFQSPDLASFLAVTNGTYDGSSLVIGNIEAQPINVVNEDQTFAGWVGFLGATVAVVDEELQVTHPGGVASGASYALATGGARKAVKVSFDARRVNGGAQGIPTWSNATADFSANFVNQAGFTAATHYDYVVSTLSGTVYVGLKTNASSTTGQIHGISHIRLAEVIPFPGYVSGGYTVVARGKTPAAGAGLKTLFCFDIGDDHDYAEVRWNAATYEISHHVVSNNLARVDNQVIGTVEPETAFKVAQVVNNRVLLYLDSVEPVWTDTVPYGGSAYARFGASIVAGQDWGDIDDGSHRFDVWNGALDDTTIRFLVGPDDSIVALGDSYAASASGGGSTSIAHLATAMGRTFINNAVGGTLLTNQLAQYLYDLTPCHSAPLFAWDGGWSGDGGAMTEDAAMEALSKMAAIKDDGKWCVAMPIVPPAVLIGGSWVFPGAGQYPVVGQLSPTKSTVDAYVARAAAAWNTADPYGDGGVRFIDSVVTYLQTLGDGSAEDNADIAAGYPPRSVFTDGVHLLDSVRELVAENVLSPALTALAF